MTREQKKAKAVEWRSEGMVLREIAERLEIPRSTVHQWLTDPTGAKNKARKRRYSGTCQECGAATTGNNGRARAPKYCADCRPIIDTVWTREAIVEAIWRFAGRYGRQPCAPDFCVSQARLHGHEWRADVFERDGDYPNTGTVQYHFGTWSAAIEAAGFKPYRRGSYPRLGQRGKHLERAA